MDHIESSDCPCEPRCILITGDDGMSKWMISHNEEKPVENHAQNVAREPL